MHHHSHILNSVDFRLFHKPDMPRVSTRCHRVRLMKSYVYTCIMYMYHQPEAFQHLQEAPHLPEACM